MKKMGFLAATVIGVVTLAGCSSPNAEDSSAAEGTTQLEKMTFAVTDQTLSAATASYVTVPVQLGYFAEEGLDVTMQPVETALAGVQAVAAGNAVCTYASAGTAVPTAASDPSVTIVGSTAGNMFRVVAPKSKGFTSVADLEGKTIGSNSATAAGVNYAIGGMKKAGVEATTDQFLPVGFGAQAALAFQQGQIDAYSAWDSPNLVIESLLDEELVDLDSVMNDLNGTSTFVCSTAVLEENPEAIAGIWRAFYKGAVFSAENPEAAIKMHWDAYPSAKPTDGSEDDRLSMAIKQLKTRLDLTGGLGSAGKYGEQTSEDLQTMVDLLTESGVIEGNVGDYDATSIFNHELVDEINDFDVEAIREEAKDYTE